MKRKLSKFMALVLSCVVALGLFASCELIGVNTDKDMDQVVAEVEVNVEGYTVQNFEKNIYKRELVSGYVNYGYQYVTSYGYTLSQTYNLILDNLANNKVIVQYAKSQMDKVNATAKFEAEDKGNAVRADRIAYINDSVKYLSDAQIKEAQYNALASVNALLDSFDENKQEETAKEVEDETITERTVPTVKAAEGELVDEEYAKKNGLDKDTTVEELADKDAYKNWLGNKYASYASAEIKDKEEGTNKPAIATTASRKSAFDEVVEMFSTYGLISSEEKGTDSVYGDDRYNFTNYTYYLDMLASNVDALIIENYEEQLSAASKTGIDAGLWDEYKAAYYTQKAKYENDLTAYESALDAWTEDSIPVLYHPNVGEKYGFVANILIGFSDEATAALNAFKAKATTNAQIETYRNELLKTLVVKDLRATWLQKGYADVEGTTATFKSDYVKTDKLNTFIGTFEDNSKYETKKEFSYFYAEGATDPAWGEKEVENNTYAFTNIVPTEMSFDTFKTNYLSLLGINSNKGTGATVDLDLIDDILFAFGTDPGSLNNYLGYVYSPSTSATTYVKEFADAAQRLVEAGVGAYEIVATDYGYHVMICTKVVEPTASDDAVIGATAETKFKESINTEGTTAYKFKKAKEASNLEKLVSDTVTFNIAKYVDKENNDYAVTKVYKTLKNLIEEADFNGENN